jgi:homogentisate 1,2-dioxygenase
MPLVKSLLLKGFDLKPEDDFLDSRKAMLLNKDCTIGLAAPQNHCGLFLIKNADADEMIFIHKGKGNYAP